jgi:large subunit ribosomal protein L25
MEIPLDEKIKLTVPVVITEPPIGVKNGGILQQPLREVEIECLPTQIPEGLEIDASAIDIGHSLHVSDLAVKEGVKILSDPKAVIINVSAPVIEEEPVAAPEEEEAAEPEVAKKGKEKEEAAEGEAEAKPEEQKEQKDTKEQKEK